MKKILVIALCLIASPALAQPKITLPPALTTSSCEPLNIFKGITAQNFLQRIKICTDDDLANAIADARTDPIDYMALACLLPVQTIKNAVVKGGLLTAFQGFRRAKTAGLILGCTNYLTTTVTLQ